MKPGVTEGALRPLILGTLSDHVVSGNCLFPGVSYVEIATVSANLADQIVLASVRFLRPCILQAFDSNACVL